MDQVDDIKAGNPVKQLTDTIAEPLVPLTQDLYTYCIFRHGVGKYIYLCEIKQYSIRKLALLDAIRFADSSSPTEFLFVFYPIPACLS